MKVKMTKEILAVIHMIQLQRLSYSILHNEILNDKHDYIADLESLFNDIPLPDGMNASRACFEAVLSYPLNDEIMKTEYAELGNKFEFGF
jgi:hypothetical protein